MKATLKHILIWRMKHIFSQDILGDNQSVLFLFFLGGLFENIYKLSGYDYLAWCQHDTKSANCYCFYAAYLEVCGRYDCSLWHLWRCNKDRIITNTRLLLKCLTYASLLRFVWHITGLLLLFMTYGVCTTRLLIRF